jgi:CRP/FNR family transcriptional regulator
MHHSSLMASNDCETCLIDINSFNEVIAGNQAFMKAYLKEYSERVLRTYRQFAVLTQKNMQARMANVILYLSENISHSLTVYNVSKADLAEFTAMSRESAIRVMKEFRDEKYIEMEDQNIVILNDKALRNIAFYG